MGQPCRRLVTLVVTMGATPRSSPAHPSRWTKPSLVVAPAPEARRHGVRVVSSRTPSSTRDVSIVTSSPSLRSDGRPRVVVNGAARARSQPSDEMTETATSCVPPPVRPCGCQRGSAVRSWTCAEDVRRGGPRAALTVLSLLKAEHLERDAPRRQEEDWTHLDAHGHSRRRRRPRRRPTGRPAVNVARGSLLAGYGVPTKKSAKVRLAKTTQDGGRWRLQDRVDSNPTASLRRCLPPAFDKLRRARERPRRVKKQQVR
jgi:hypothetical protein